MQRLLATSKVLVLIFAGVFPALQFAQEGSGKLTGSLTDSTGAIVPDAEISIVHRGTGLTRSVRTDAAGDYAFPALPIGIYDVSASRTGFATLKSTGVTVAVGSTTR